MKKYLAIVVAVGLSASTVMGGVTYKKIVDHLTPRWDGSGSFDSDLYFHVTINGENVAFVAEDISNPPQYIPRLFKLVNGLGSLVCDRSTHIPNSNSSLRDVGAVCLSSGGRIVFTAELQNGQLGIYGEDEDGALVRYVDSSTLVPGETYPFSSVSDNRLAFDDNGDITFIGYSQGGEGLYRLNDSSLEVLADYHTMIPPNNTDTFTRYHIMSARNGYTAFTASGPTIEDNYGLYLDDGAALTRIVDRDTAIPGSSDHFELFSGPRVDSDGSILFHAQSDSGLHGIYLYDAGAAALRLIADDNTRLPGFNATWRSVGDCSINGGNVAFYAVQRPYPPNLPTNFGVYVKYEGSMIKVARRNQLIDGERIDSLTGTPIISGNRVLLNFMYPVGTDYMRWALYVAELNLGDLDDDGNVTLIDLATLLSNYGITAGAAREAGDIDGDGAINLIDLAILLKYYGHSWR